MKFATDSRLATSYPSPSGLGLRLAGRPSGPREPPTNINRKSREVGVRDLRFVSPASHADF